VLFLNDPPKEIARKIRKAFTGGRATVEEQRRLGATPEICSVWAAWRSKFAPEDAEFQRITDDCRSGALLCGDCKAHLIEKVDGFLKVHNERRERAAEIAESLIILEPPKGTPDPPPPGREVEEK
jgi:tryptophanyl-tRNA synthetase